MAGRGLAQAWLMDRTGRVLYLGERVGLGRAMENECLLLDQGVSRRHALIRRDGSGVYWLSDLDSANGTYLNVARVERETRLRDGDRIRIGRFELLFHQAGVKSVQGHSTTLVGDDGYERQSRWFMLVDIEDATGYLRQNGTDCYQARLSGWLGQLERVIERYGGVVHDFVGDGCYCWWSDASGVEGCVVGAIRALRAGEASGPFTFRLVVHCGEVQVATCGSLHKAGVCGEAIHYLFRLEKVAGRNGSRNLFSREAAERLRPRLPGLTPFEGEVPNFGIQELYTVSLGPELAGGEGCVSFAKSP